MRIYVLTIQFLLNIIDKLVILEYAFLMKNAVLILYISVCTLNQAVTDQDFINGSLLTPQKWCRL